MIGAGIVVGGRRVSPGSSARACAAWPAAPSDSKIRRAAAASAAARVAQPASGRLPVRRAGSASRVAASLAGSASARTTSSGSTRTSPPAADPRE
jgi:hypothetical protein